MHHAEGDTWVATGELGARPKVFVWSATTLDVLAIIRGVHRVGVLHVAFSGDGVLLATVGAPHEGVADRPAAQLVAIYDWRATLLLFDADVPAATLVLDARVVHGRDLATCGVNHVQFWRVRMDVSGADVAPGDKGDASEEAATKIDTFRAERGLLCRKAPPQPFLAVAGTGAHVVVGAASGHLLLFVGRTCVQAIKAHAGAVTSPTRSKGGIQACAKRDWRSHPALGGNCDGLDAGSSIDAAALGARDPCVLAVCWDWRGIAWQLQQPARSLRQRQLMAAPCTTASPLQPATQSGDSAAWRRTHHSHTLRHVATTRPLSSGTARRDDQCGLVFLTQLHGAVPSRLTADTWRWD